MASQDEDVTCFSGAGEVCLRILIVGLGSIGCRHLSNTRRLQPDAHIIICHHCRSPQRGTEVDAAADSVVFSVEEALALRPDAAIIANPSPLHVPIAQQLVEGGVHLLIEKPLSNGLPGVDALLETCLQRSLVLAVGYSLRFHKPLEVMRQAVMEGTIGRPLSIRAAVGQYLPDWRKGMDYRRAVSARRSLGGGALLELSHELDYVMWLIGGVTGVLARTEHSGNLEIDVEDVAELVLSFACGALGSIHLDMVDRAATRSCRVVGTEGTLDWSEDDSEVKLFSASSGEWRTLLAYRGDDRNEMYIAELRHFFNCVQGTETPLVDGREGRRVLEVVLAARQSAEWGKVVRL